MNSESLESFLHLDRIDIGRLTIENPKPDEVRTFDVNKDITEEDWELLKQDLEWLRNCDSWLGFVNQAMCMKILKPERQAELGLTDAVWESIKQN